MSRFSDDWYRYGGNDDESSKPRMKRDSSGFLREVGLLYEFDCPECDANNPWDDGFKTGSEVICHYCGQEFRVLQAEGRSKPKFKAL